MTEFTVAPSIEVRLAGRARKDAIAGQVTVSVSDSRDGKTYTTKAPVLPDGSWSAVFAAPSYTALTGPLTVEVKVKPRKKPPVRWTGTYPGVPVADPDAAPAGDPTAFAHITTTAGKILRWNPCRPIPYRINPAGASDGVLDTVHEAFTRIAAATGLQFEYAGETTAPAFVQGLTAVPTGEEGIYVAFASEESDPALEGEVGGRGGISLPIRPAQGSPLDWRTARAGALIDIGEGDHPGFKGARPIGGTITHEIGHALGLLHVQDPAQLMYPVHTYGSPTTLQAGDIAGLRAMVDRGCL